MGVRHAVITVGNQVVFDGDIDKGCGNQIFDYAKAINLLDMEPQSTPAVDKVSLFGSVDHEIDRPKSRTESQTSHSVDESARRSNDRFRQRSHSRDSEVRSSRPKSTKSARKSLSEEKPPKHRSSISSKGENPTTCSMYIHSPYNQHLFPAFSLTLSIFYASAGSFEDPKTHQKKNKLRKSKMSTDFQDVSASSSTAAKALPANETETTQSQ